MVQQTADSVYKKFKRLTADERARFFALLAEPWESTQQSHDQVFGHLETARFTADEAAQYLEISMSTFRRYVAQGALQAVGQIGRSQLYAVATLKTFKRSLRQRRQA